MSQADSWEQRETTTHYSLVVHTPASNLDQALETDTHKLWLPTDIAGPVIQYGLVDWVITKAN